MFINGIGELILQQRLLTSEELKLAFQLQKQTGKRLTEVLVEKGFMTEEELLRLMEQKLGFLRVNLDKFNIIPSVMELIPEYIARKYTVCPLKINENTLVLATNDPSNVPAIDDIKMISGYDVQIVLAPKDEIERAINKHFRESEQVTINAHHDGDLEKTRFLDITVDGDDIQKAPAISLVNDLFQQAVEKNASDIHIEPQENSIRIRYRVDGVLLEVMSLPRNLLSGISARIKIMAGMDITKKRIPQDGHIQINVMDKIIDVRVSTLPTIHGEKLVLRILNRQHFLRTLDSLGFTDEQVDKLYQMLNFPFGMILVTGPTGCGKTTTLYAMLEVLNTSSKNIVTLEEPVEYSLPGINQVQINPKAGVTFATGLRAILRQDPNVIMVGEIRDVETANIAIRAALTGHLVLTTLHTNTASGAITRLLDMGIEPYLLAACVVGVVSQRLVRKICSKCKEKYSPSPMESTFLQMSKNDLTLYHGIGCNNCSQTGYFQRTAIGEIVNITENHRKIIGKNCNAQQFDMVSRSIGCKSIRENGINLVLKGLTTVDEIMRTIYRTEGVD